jgi:hypothetical protein
MKTTIEVEITNLEADENYYSFKYSITVDGEHKGDGEYESDHAWQNDIEGLKKMLEDGEAVKLALEQEL